MPPIGILIKPASSKCNLRCNYCFYNTIAENRSIRDFGFMPEGTLEMIIHKVLEFADGEATFSFQGGEPTLCGLDFYRKAVELENKYNVKNVMIKNCIQTNGILLDETWAAFLRENKFLVGLSLDGPGDINDANRVDCNGKGTFQRLMKTVSLLDKYQVEYNILFVVTSLSARSPDKIYSFFRKHDFRFLQFIPCIDPEGTKRGEQAFSLKPGQYAIFLKKMFDRWCEDFLGGREISMRYFDNLVRIVMGSQPETCSMLGQCQCQLVFEGDGSAYPCDFYVTDYWCIGNIHDNGIMEMYGSDRCREFLTTSLSAKQLCRNCKVNSLCHGGCRRDRVNTLTGVLERNYYCEGYTNFLEYAFPKLVTVARYVTQAGSR